MSACNFRTVDKALSTGFGLGGRQALATPTPNASQSPFRRPAFRVDDDDDDDSDDSVGDGPARQRLFTGRVDPRTLPLLHDDHENPELFDDDMVINADQETAPFLFGAKSGVEKVSTAMFALQLRRTHGRLEHAARHSIPFLLVSLKH